MHSPLHWVSLAGLEQVATEGGQGAWELLELGVYSCSFPLAMFAPISGSPSSSDDPIIVNGEKS